MPAGHRCGQLPGNLVSKLIDRYLFTNESVTQGYLRSHLSLALASALVCHCMLDGLSAPSDASGWMWSIT